MPFLCCKSYLTRFQLFAALVFFLAYIMDANSLYPIHLNYRPEWKCDDNSANSPTTSARSDTEFGQNCTLFHQCPPGNLTFRAPYHSAVQEFGLLCGRREYFATMMSTAYYAGMLIGAFLFGQLSDMYGRKKIVIICCLVVSTGSFGSALADTWITLTACRMLIGAAVAGSFNVHFTYTVELVAVNQRLFVRGTFNWGFARIFFTAFSLFLPYWRETCILHGCYPFIVIALVVLLVPESPKWLASKGRIEELKKAKEWITWFNGGVYDVPVPASVMAAVGSSAIRSNGSICQNGGGSSATIGGSDTKEKTKTAAMASPESECLTPSSPLPHPLTLSPSNTPIITNDEKSPIRSPAIDDEDDDDDDVESIGTLDNVAARDVDKMYSPKDLFSSRRMTEITFTIWMMWFTASLSSYANDLNSGNLSGDFFVNQFLFGLLIGASKISLFLVDFYFPKFSRRTLHQSSQFSIFISYVAIITLLSVNNSSYEGKNDALNFAVRIVSLIGSVLIEYTWDACVLCAAECFPTVVRSIGTGTASTWARVGGILATQMVYFRNLWEPSPYAAVAVVGLLSLLISYRFLPDTKGKELYNQLPSTGTRFTNYNNNDNKNISNGHTPTNGSPAKNMVI